MTSNVIDAYFDSMIECTQTQSCRSYYAIHQPQTTQAPSHSAPSDPGKIERKVQGIGKAHRPDRGIPNGCEGSSNHCRTSCQVVWCRGDGPCRRRTDHNPRRAPKPSAASSTSFSWPTCAKGNPYRIQSIQANGIAYVERTVPARACPRDGDLGASDRAHRILDIVCGRSQGNGGTARECTECGLRFVCRQIIVVRIAC